MNEWVQILGGGVLLYLGAEWLVGGSSTLALALRIPQLLVGLTVVAYGTSAPEIVVGIQAALGGHGAVALGNVVGSNIANVGLILGLAALIKPAHVDGALRRRELPVLLATTAVLPLLLIDDVIGRVEAAALVAVAVFYTGWMVRSARASSIGRAWRETRQEQAAADLAGAPEAPTSLTAAPSPSPSPVRSSRAAIVRAALTAAAGLGILLVGGTIFVDGAVLLARSLGMSDRLVGVTIVAVGTSLPELVTSVIAARRGHADLAVGNVIGSNIFNLLLCLGLAGLAGPVGAPLATMGFDLGALAVMTVVGAAFIRSERTITRGEGAIALVLFGLYTGLTIARG